MEEAQQKIIFKLQMFEQHIQQLQQQLQAVEQGVVELQSLSFGLDELIGKEETPLGVPQSTELGGKEIMAPIGRGIFAKAKLVSEDLLVGVGDKNLVTKTIPETKEILHEQIDKLQELQKELEENLEKVGLELQKTLMEAQECEKNSEKQE